MSTADTNIMVYTCGIFDKQTTDQVTSTIQQAFKTSVETADIHFDMIKYYDPSRRQYNADMLLRKIEELQQPADLKSIGLFTVDLFIPILTYIFGQAYLNGSSAVSSTFRLHNEHYGLEKNKPLFLSRIKKEVVHELGHTFGLIHCHTPGCVMQSSTYVEDIDQKTELFCSDCHFKVMTYMAGEQG